MYGCTPFTPVKAKHLRVDDRVAFCDRQGGTLIRTVRLIERQHTIFFSYFVYVEWAGDRIPYSGYDSDLFHPHERLIVSHRSSW